MAATKKPFKSVPHGERRTLRIPVLVNATEKEQLDHAARIRNLNTSDWMRRAGLGRKADVRYDTQIVLALTQLVHAIRSAGMDLLALQEHSESEKAQALLNEMQELLVEAKAALLRIDK